MISDKHVVRGSPGTRGEGEILKHTKRAPKTRKHLFEKSNVLKFHKYVLFLKKIVFRKNLEDFFCQNSSIVLSFNHSIVIYMYIL